MKYIFYLVFTVLITISLSWKGDVHTQHLVGRWVDTTDNAKDTLSITADRKFVIKSVFVYNGLNLGQQFYYGSWNAVGDSIHFSNCTIVTDNGQTTIHQKSYSSKYVIVASRLILTSKAGTEIKKVMWKKVFTSK